MASADQSIGASASFSFSPSSEYSGLISFEIDWFDLPAVEGTLKSLLQHHNSKASILQCSAFFMIQLSCLYMTTCFYRPPPQIVDPGRSAGSLPSPISLRLLCWMRQCCRGQAEPCACTTEGAHSLVSRPAPHLPSANLS